jgi:hypothetical protein
LIICKIKKLQFTFPRKGIETVLLVLRMTT